MILIWLLVWVLDNTPAVIFSPAWNVWAVTLVISLVLL
jgi:hypothetical protein